MNTLSRRSFSKLLCLSAAAWPLGQAFAQNAVIVRPMLGLNASERYEFYVLPGDFIGSNTPLTIVDPASGLSIKVYYPRNAETSRVVVFSHGALLDPQAYGRLLSHWASHGFTVLAPVHEDALAMGGYVTHSQTEEGYSEWQFNSIYESAQLWIKRARDCQTALNLAGRINEAVGHQIDLDRPVIAGHGLGAHVAQLLMGGRADGVPDDLNDDRFFSAILMSPPGEGIMGLGPDSWASIDKPLLVMTGARDEDITGQSAERKFDSFIKSPANNKHLSFFRDGTHSVYIGQRARSQEEENIHFHDVQAVTTSFLLAYGNYDEDAFADVSGDFFQKTTGERVLMRYR